MYRNFFHQKEYWFYERNEGLVLVVLLYKKVKRGRRSKHFNSQNKEVRLCEA